MGELLVVTGPPGAGKSTVAAILAAQFDPSALVEGDVFFGFVRQGWVEPWLPEADPQNTVVTQAAAAAAGRLADGGYTVVYDGVVGPWYLDVFACAAGTSVLHYAVLMPPEKVVVERVRTRREHGFTDLDATRRMYREFRDAAPDERHLVPADGDPARVAAAVRERLDDGR